MTQRAMSTVSGVQPSQWWAAAIESVRKRIMPEQQHTAVRGDGFSVHMPLAFASRAARLIRRLILLIAVALLLLALATFAFRAAFSDRVYPAVAVGDVSVGGMTVNEAADAVEERTADLQQGTFSFSYDGQVWTPSLAELGAVVDAEGSVQSAFALGRDQNAVSRLGFANQLLKEDQRVPLRTSVDNQVLGAWFASVNTGIDMRAVDAGLIIDGANVSVSPDSTGIVVDEQAATTIILDALTSLEPIVAELPVMVEEPTVRAADLQEAATQLQASLSQPVVALFDSNSWEIDAIELAEFMTIDIAADGNGGAFVETTMDTDRLTSWLRERFSGEINRAPSDARVGWQSGVGLVAIDASIDGAALRSSAFADVVAERFLTGDGSLLDIPVVTTKPEIDSNNLDALKINSLLARGDSNYGGQAWQRDTNIELATNLLSGELVAPGDEFSFNDAIGAITQDKGYVESGVIVNGRASTDDGGGVCQVSTTVFRAAILAGLPITDWAEHTQRLTIYERDGWTAGYDASILQIPGLDTSQWGDLKFRNDTGGYLLVQAWNEYPYNIVEIYGNDDGREVIVGDAQLWEGVNYPDDIEVVDETRGSGFVQQTEWPRMPAETLFNTSVTYADGTVKEREFYSEYQGNGNVWTVSPDMRGQSPAS